MPTYSEQRQFKFNTAQLYKLVIDIEKYPEFLPWCSAARIIENKEQAIIAELAISFKIYSDRYTSLVHHIEPANAKEEGKIDVSLVAGPFSHLINRWHFIPSEQGCAVDFFIDFEFKNSVFKGLITNVFEHAAQKMIVAFEQRANKIYG